MRLKNLSKRAIYFFAFCFLLPLSACKIVPKEDDDQVRNSINVRQNPNPYYYQQQQYQPPQYQPQPYYYYPPQPQYKQPYQQQPYGGAGSRFYSNPYAIPPSPQYQQYDADQYYVPPTYYNNVEPQPAANKIINSTSNSSGAF